VTAEVAFAAAAMPRRVSSAPTSGILQLTDDASP
jgi:hypothetical protein